MHMLKALKYTPASLSSLFGLCFVILLLIHSLLLFVLRQTRNEMKCATQEDATTVGLSNMANSKQVLRYVVQYVHHLVV